MLKCSTTAFLEILFKRINLVRPKFWSFFQGYSLKVEILSLSLDPSSSVALDKSVQQVYVEYRLLGIPMETTETPMSLQKPKEGEEIHFNFSRGMVDCKHNCILFMWCFNNIYIYCTFSQSSFR